MATTFTADTTLSHGGTGSRSTKSGWLRRALHAMVIARTEQAFHSLDDRTLAHLGLTRAEIPTRAREIHEGFRGD
ncbi:hypothetical protein [Arenibaculum pallidiluteum]|uniref:hypothetical protein n=1 Tax=Arenibaculum pallidiluteum TaxID=2812559 RepID=UPI001A97B483|nr:hypothetical protein [Arenibaculum pallidiluteum]